MGNLYQWLYRWIDSLWQWIAERVFIRFDFDLKLEDIKNVSAEAFPVFVLTHANIIEFLILSSWCRAHGLGAISVTNRKRILALSNPRMFFRLITGRTKVSDLFLSNHPGPRLLYCPTSERKKPFQPVPVELLLADLYTATKSDPKRKAFHFFPMLIVWRKHVRGEARKPSEYFLGLGLSPTFLGKIWYLLRARRDSSVRGLPHFPMFTSTSEVDPIDESEALRLARTTRRRVLVEVQLEIRVSLGPRHAPPQSVKETLLRDPEIRQLIDETAKREGVDRKKVMSRTYGFLTEIVANYRYRTVEVIYAVLTWVFRRLFDGVNVLDEDIKRVRETMKTRPVVFVSCHRSHLDYLVIPYVMFDEDLITPHIVAGINLSFWPMGPIARSAGGFFIRRSFRGNPLYALCLRKYVEYLLRHKYNIKFFIEGTRSRSGKLLPPAYGMLKMVMETQHTGAIEDIALIPVSICYDEVPEEGAYTKELGGAEKKKETASELIKSTEIIRHNFGKVYVRLAPAVSVRDIYRNSDEAGQDRALLLQKTAFQLCKTINDITPITPKAIVSSVFLGHPDEQVPLDEVLRISYRLVEYATAFHFPLSTRADGGFKRAAEQIVKRLTKSGIIAVNDTAMPRRFGCDPKKRGALNFYKNNSIHCFVTASIVMLAFFQTLRDSAETDAPEKFRARLTETALTLRNFLKFEFFFSPTPVFLKELDENLDYFFGKVDWQTLLLPALVERIGQRLDRLADVALLMRLTADLFESYATLLNYLKKNPPGTTDKKTIVQKVVKFGVAELAEQRIRFPESISVQNYTTGLLLLENLKFAELKQEGEKRSIIIAGWNSGMQRLLEQLEAIGGLASENLADFVKQHGFQISAAFQDPSDPSYEPTSLS